MLEKREECRSRIGRGGVGVQDYIEISILWDGLTLQFLKRGQAAGMKMGLADAHK